MNTYLPGLLGILLLAGAAWADGVAGTGQTTASASIGNSSGCCAATGCATACKVCVPECTSKKKEKVTYGCKCVDFCVPKCSLSHRGCHDGACGEKCACRECEAQGGTKCGHVRTKKVLVKKVQVTEHNVLECVPKTVK